jgi:O-antigen/teichoic acid export membrane protein
MSILINMFFGPLFNAAKGIANYVESAISSFATNFLGASVPQIIKSYASGDYEYCFKLNFKSGKFGFFLFMLIALPVISIINPLLTLWLSTPPKMANVFSVLALIYVQTNTLGGTLQNVVQATGKVRNYQLMNGVLKLLPILFVYFLFKIGAPVATYLYVLILTSFIGLFVQLFAVRLILPYFPVARYLKEVTLRELATYLIPCAIALVMSTHTLSYILSFGVAILVFIISFVFVWFLGFTSGERIWAKNMIMNKIHKHI